MSDNNSKVVAPRDSKLLLIAELSLFAAIFVADELGYVPFSKTPFLLVLAWASLLVRRVKWKDIGLRLYRNLPLTLMIGIAAGAGMEALQLFVSQPLLIDLTGQKPDLSEFTVLIGNAKLLLLALVLVWTLAAFGEEMVHRGYLLNRLGDLFAPARESTLLALVVMSVVFGFAHSYQGITGIIDEGLMGLILGLLYFSFGRNLAIPIVAHGMQDTIDVFLIYSGNYPGLN